MIFTRNHHDWLALYKRRRIALFNCAMTRNCNAELLKNAAILLLEAHHCGPWRMIWALFKYEITLVFNWYVWKPFHSIKRKLGFRPNTTAALAEGTSANLRDAMRKKKRSRN